MLKNPNGESIKFSELIAKKEFIGFIIALLGAFFLFPFFFEVHLFPLGSTELNSSVMTQLNKTYPMLSLDPSWTVAINKFNIDNRIWGEDIAFTYGPLGYLSTRVGWGAQWYTFFLFDLFIGFNFFYLFYNGYIKSKNLIATIILIVSTCILLPSTLGSGNSLVMLAFLVFWLRQSLDEKKHLFSIMQVLILVLIFFIKFNTSIIALVFFIMGLIYRAFFLKEDKKTLMIYLLTPFLLIFILSKILNVSLLGYFLGGLNTVSGFNEIMYIDNPVVKEYKYASGIIFIALFILLVRIYKVKDQKINLFKNILILVLFSISFYVLYKQAFLRNDIEHILDFNKFGLLFILCICDFHFTETFKFSNIFIGIIIVLSFLFSHKRDDKLFNVNERVFKSKYLKELRNFSANSGFHLYQNNTKFPSSVLQKIGNKTVDAYAWNIQMLLENKLNYKPRPAFQSYFAYTPYLENLNFEFYNSINAPEFLLYDMDSFDGRSGFFDESKFHLAVLKNYEFIEFFYYFQRPILLLKRKSGALPKITLEKINEYQININDIIQPKKDVYYELHVSNTLKGKITALTDHSPDISLVVTTKNGKLWEYKTSKKLLESGFFSTYLFNSTADVYDYIKKENLKEENQVSGYSLKIKNPRYFNKNVVVTEYRIN